MKKTVFFVGLVLILFCIVLTTKAQKVAVLPSVFYIDGQLAPKMKAEQVQKEIVALYKKKSTVFQYSSTVEIKKKLKENDIDYRTVAEVEPERLAEILGVDYVVYANIMMDQEGAQTNNTSNTSTSKGIISGDDIKTKTQSSETRIKYATVVEYNIYKSNGEMVYSESRKSNLTYPTAYKGTLKWHVKHSPL